MKHPSEYPGEAFAELEAFIKPGRYCRFDDQAQLPPALSDIGGFPARENYLTTVLMAATSSQHPLTIGTVTPATSSPIYRVCTLRTDQHGDEGELHSNQDDVLLFADTAGRTWQMYAKDQPGHYEQLSSDSGLDAVPDIRNWPRAPTGTLKAMEEQGGPFDFSTGQGA